MLTLSTLIVFCFFSSPVNSLVLHISHKTLNQILCTTSVVNFDVLTDKCFFHLIILVTAKSCRKKVLSGRTKQNKNRIKQTASRVMKNGQMITHKKRIQVMGKLKIKQQFN